MNPRRLAAVLAAVTAAAILVMRLGYHPEPDTAATPPATAVTSLATPATAPTGAPADEVATPGSPAGEPTATSPTDDIDDDSAFHRDPAPPTTDQPDAAATAAAFARAWTRHTGPDARHWAGRLTSLCTATLAAKVRHVDPAVVPADTVTGAPQVTATGDWADATIATDAGTLQLTLIHTSRWRVDTLDWTPTP